MRTYPVPVHSASDGVIANRFLGVTILRSPRLHSMTSSQLPAVSTDGLCNVPFVSVSQVTNIGSWLSWHWLITNVIAAFSKGRSGLTSTQAGASVANVAASGTTSHGKIVSMAGLPLPAPAEPNSGYRGLYVHPSPISTIAGDMLNAAAKRRRSGSVDLEVSPSKRARSNAATATRRDDLDHRESNSHTDPTTVDGDLQATSQEPSPESIVLDNDNDESPASGPEASPLDWRIDNAYSSSNGTAMQALHELSEALNQQESQRSSNTTSDYTIPQRSVAAHLREEPLSHDPASIHGADTPAPNADFKAYVGQTQQLVLPTKVENDDDIQFMGSRPLPCTQLRNDEVGLLKLRLNEASLLRQLAEARLQLQRQ